MNYETLGIFTKITIIRWKKIWYNVPLCFGIFEYNILLFSSWSMKYCAMKSYNWSGSMKMIVFFSNHYFQLQNINKQGKNQKKYPSFLLLFCIIFCKDATAKTCTKIVAKKSTLLSFTYIFRASHQPFGQSFNLSKKLLDGKVFGCTWLQMKAAIIIRKLANLKTALYSNNMQ